MGLRGWHKSRKSMVRKFKVNAVAKFWFRSKILRQLRNWNIRRKALDSPKLYLPLGSGIIRLLRIHPGSALEDIQCEFVYVNLDSPEDYVALSYTWGQDAPSIPILVNGKVVLVTENLYLALLHLRKRDVPTTWVDALCINQEDLQERASQVQRMKDVYQQARMVIVWLGDENQSSAQAFDTFHEMVEHLDWDSRVPTWLMRAISEDRERWRAIIDTLSRQWFCRTWVLQEVLAAQDVLVLCGKDIIRMALFLKIIHSLLLQNLLPSIQEDGSFTYRDFPTLAKGAVMQLRFLVGARIKDTDVYTYNLLFDRELLNLLASTQWSEATDIRDKVYGLLSLASDAKSLGWYDSSQWVSFRVDYTLSAEQVFINTAKAIIGASKSLEILRFAGGLPNKMIGMPSWVPDWGKRSPSPSPSNYPHFERTNSRWKKSWRHENEGAFESFNWRGLSDRITESCRPAFTFDKNDALVVRGIHFDTITQISKHTEYEPKPLRFVTNAETQEEEQVLEEMEHHLDSLHLWVKGCTQLAARCSPYPTGESTEDALWRTLENDFTEKKRDGPLPFEGRLGNLRATQSAFTFFKNKYLSTRSNNPGVLSEIVLEGATLRLETLLSACPNTFPHQRFATTRKKYMGFVPQDAQVGDIICVMYGCETPFVLQKHSRRKGFELVGNAKIQGFDFDYAAAELRGLEGRRWKKSFPMSEELGGNRTMSIKYKRSRNFTIL